jgi:putative polyketide hydroxylase
MVADPFTGLDLNCYRVGADLRDRQGCFMTSYDLSAAGAALIRPDGFIAWRADAMADDPRATIANALRSILIEQGRNPWVG